MKIICCGIFPALQRTMALRSFKPGTVCRVRSTTVSAGGKATNTARVLKALGEKPVLFGFTGGNTGKVIRHLLDGEGIEHNFVETEIEARVCQTIIADDIIDFTELVEDCPEIPSKDWKALLKKFKSLEKSSVIISGTLPAHTPPEIYTELMKLARDKPVILDTSGKPLLAALEQRPALVKINAAELLKTVNSDSIDYAAQEILAQGAIAVGVTQGPKSALLVTREETVRFSIPKVNIVSTLGCGDSVNAGIAFALQNGNSLKEAFVFGLACGVSNAMNRLPGVVNFDQIAAIVPQIKAEK